MDPEPGSYVRFLFESIAEGGATPPADLPPGPPFFQYAADDEFEALLRRAGLSDVSVQPLRFTHRVDDLDAFRADLMDGTVRAGIVIRAQPSDVQNEVRRLYAAKLSRWRTGTSHDIACAVKLGAATRSRHMRV